MFDDDRYRIDEEAKALLRGEGAKTVLLALRKALIPLAAGGEGGVGPELAPQYRGIIGIVRSIQDNKTGLKGKKLYLPIRAAVTGRLHGPELDRIFALLGPVSLLRRVEKALALS
jgi:nondiscriminating glutamyl-tRNA synthetase